MQEVVPREEAKGMKNHKDQVELKSCPFCKEEDFDLIGLKHHFGSGYCDVFNKTISA